MTPTSRTTLPFRVRGGNVPAKIEVWFHPADGPSISGPDLDLTAGAVGTWELLLTVEAPVAAGGGFLVERYGFLLSHCVQNTRPRGRDFVTLRARTQAHVRLELNELNQSNCPAFARIVVERGTLAPGDELGLVIGDTSQGGPGSEVYDVTCQGRIVASVDRSGGLDYRQIRGGEIRLHVSSDPTPTLLRLLGPSIARPGEPFALHLAVYDRNHNVCTQYTGTVELRAEASQLNGLPPEVRLGTKDAGFAVIQGVTAQAPGLVRIEAHDRAHALSTLSNPLLVQSDPETLLLWGDLHSHSWGDISMGLMDDPTPVLHPAGRHAQARGQARLDFAAPGPMAPPDQTHRPCRLGSASGRLSSQRRSGQVRAIPSRRSPPPRRRRPQRHLSRLGGASRARVGRHGLPGGDLRRARGRPAGSPRRRRPRRLGRLPHGPRAGGGSGQRSRISGVAATARAPPRPPSGGNRLGRHPPAPAGRAHGRAPLPRSLRQPPQHARLRHRLRSRGRGPRSPLRAPRHLGRRDATADPRHNRRAHHPGRAGQRTSGRKRD